MSEKMRFRNGAIIDRFIVWDGGISIYDKNSGMTLRLSDTEAQAMLEGYVPAGGYQCPEVVHIELTSRCNLRCPYCYVPRNDRNLPHEDWSRIIRQLADAGVFQITFGGGEPLLRDDAPALAKFADDSGMNVTITTNGTPLRDFEPADLKVFRQINISYHEEGRKAGFDLEGALSRLSMAGIPTGIHLIMRREYLPEVPRLAELARKHRSVLLLLSYKPVAGSGSEAVPVESIMSMAMELSGSGLQVAVDNLTTGQCFQKERLAVISASGEVFPCSFVRESLGNVLRTDFRSIWESRGSKVPCPYRARFGGIYKYTYIH
jgi:[mycofactocin precursor peptide]-tyrosine decarboxylase / 3-amino-5-[(4-hydroxyphenyl)methyl]-4,4-dimethylpyrrolidin-2-one synthase